MKKRSLLLLCLLPAILARPLHAQDTADPVSDKSRDLEAQLSQTRDTSPQGATLMMELIELYHAEGRAFGLVRTGQRFTKAHPTHPKHAEVMLQLLDGLKAASLHEDILSTARQFLDRHGNHSKAGEVAAHLARVSDRDGKIQNRDKAAAWHRVWTLKGPDAATAGYRALELYDKAGGTKEFTAGAALAEEMINTLPVGHMAALAGYRGFHLHRRAQNWSGSTSLGLNILKKKLPLNDAERFTLYYDMGENYRNQQQYQNATKILLEARKLNPKHEENQKRYLQNLYDAKAPGGDLEREAKAFGAAFPDSSYKMWALAFAAHAFARDEKVADALRVAEEVIPQQAYHHDIVGNYIRWKATDEATTQQAADFLASAATKNTDDPFRIRYHLAFSIFRDRMKDEAKTRQALTDLIVKTPTNDGAARTAMHHLLNYAKDENDFRALLAPVLKAINDNPDLVSFGDFLQDWVKGASGDKKRRSNANIAKAETERLRKDTDRRNWASAFDRNKGGNARAALLKSNLTPARRKQLLQLHMDGFLAHWKSEIKAQAIPFVQEFLKLEPNNYHRSANLLELAHHKKTDDQLHRLAVDQILKTKPTYNDYNSWIRLMRSAEHLEDEGLTKRSLKWIEDCQKVHGVVGHYAPDIGLSLEKQGLKNEAMAYWKTRVMVERDSDNARRCADEVLKRTEDPAAKHALCEAWAKDDSAYLGNYYAWIAHTHAEESMWADVERVMRTGLKRQQARAPRSWGLYDSLPNDWRGRVSSDKELPSAERVRIYQLVSDLKLGRVSAGARMSLLPEADAPTLSPIQQQVLLHEACLEADNSSSGWDHFMPTVQQLQERQDWAGSSALLAGMLAYMDQVDGGRKKTGRDLIARSYTKMGSLGLDIAADSPLAPLLEIGLYLRLGDQEKANEAYRKNLDLFDEHQNKLPIELLLFAAGTHVTAGGDENHDRAESVLRSWMIANGEKESVPATDKASVQLLLGRNYYKAGRYDVARSEFTSIKNTWPESPQSIEADFGIGESFMSQKVFDKAEDIFTDLAGSSDNEIAIRAEFLRGVLANRRGDREDARQIFRNVLERVPNIELANETLYNLAEVYGVEQRYMDQLELLRTVGRLGQQSKRWHTPGTALSIVVQDSDLGISRGHTRIPVIVRTKPGGDEELAYLTSGGAGKGLFLTEIDTVLGQATQNDDLLQLKGNDLITVDYPDDFKAQFKYQLIADNEIHVAADAEFDAQSQAIKAGVEETFSQRLRKESQPMMISLLQSLKRPGDQIKPGNPIYIRVEDSDRDQSGAVDNVPVKLMATSGDEVTVMLTETGPHAGIFEGRVPTGELPAGALATDSAIDHNPLHAIDHDMESAWKSEPNGASPKHLTIDMKDLFEVSYLNIQTPSQEKQTPVRVDLEGSYDGRFWYTVAQHPKPVEVAPLDIPFGEMTRLVYRQRKDAFGSWDQVVSLLKDATPTSKESAIDLTWMPQEDEDYKRDGGVVVAWTGKIVQRRGGGIRVKIDAEQIAVMVNNRLVIPLTRSVLESRRTTDMYLPHGVHDLAIVTWTSRIDQGAKVTMARESTSADAVRLGAFRKADFDLKAPDIAELTARTEALIDLGDSSKQPDGLAFTFPKWDLRHMRLAIHEYLGEAVAINNVEIGHEESKIIPTEDDVLSLATNNELELTAGDTAEIHYIDEITGGGAQRNRLMTKKLTATYNNATIQPMNYEFLRDGEGSVVTIRKALMRIEPGERIGIEVTDFDMDETADKDTIMIEVVLGTQVLEVEGIETEANSGVFRSEVDTTDGSGTNNTGKLTVAAGEVITLRYKDQQNTFPGHATWRENQVFVNQPTEATIRVVGTKLVTTKNLRNPRKAVFAPRDNESDGTEVAGVSFQIPLTIEVIDPDAALDELSTIEVELAVADQPRQTVTCRLTTLHGEATTAPPDVKAWDLYEGRFLGQIVMVLGGPDSPNSVPYLDNNTSVAVTYLSVKRDDVTDEVNLMMPVLNVAGSDIIQARYNDASRPDKTPTVLSGQARLRTDGSIMLTEADFESEASSLHVGEKLFVAVNDPDMDRSDMRDSIEVTITTDAGEKETMKLEETLSHSGLFTGGFLLKDQDKPTPGNQGSLQPEIEAFFGDTVSVHYVDAEPSSSDTSITLCVSAPIAVGTDGALAAFSKVFGDGDLAIQTQFHIAESYFELFKGHLAIGREEEASKELEAGRRTLSELIEDYPDPKYIPRVSYLLGQFAQELEDWSAAAQAYETIVRDYPDHTLAADAQYKLAQCYEEAGEFDAALEAYVTLASTYPKSPLIANVMIRINDYFYKGTNFVVAAQVGEKFVERFEDHEYASKMAFRVGQCLYKEGQIADLRGANARNEFVKSADAFDRFGKKWPDDILTPDALFWAGEAYRTAGNNPEAFRRYNRCRWEFPESDAAKYARGRLLLPEMQTQFEREANLDE